LTQICTKSFVGWGFAPDPNGLAYIGGRERGDEERKERGDRMKDEGGSSSFALGKKRKLAAYAREDY